MLSTMDPTVGTFAGSIVAPIDVLTMDIDIPMEDILPTPMEDILLTPMEDILLTPMEAMGWAMEATGWAMEATGWAMEDIIVHPISAEGLFTNTSATGVRLRWIGRQFGGAFALRTRPCGSPCGRLGGSGGWWFWPRRHHSLGSYLGRIPSEPA